MGARTEIMNSTESLGHGMYNQLSPVITLEGRAAGWNYLYPVMINRGGVNFTKLGFTLDDLIAAGWVKLEMQVHTGF